MDDDLDGVFDDESGAVARRERSTSASARSRPRTKQKSRPNLFVRLVNFIREVFAELQKVIWPTRRELVTYATVVVVFVAVVMTYVALLDLGFVKAMIFVFGTE
jgi:preprotein translocase subunit SecE